MREIYQLDIFGEEHSAESDKVSCEAFFRSGAFDIFMPNTDGEDLIKALQRKAEEGATIAVNYYY